MKIIFRYATALAALCAVLLIGALYTAGTNPANGGVSEADFYRDGYDVVVSEYPKSRSEHLPYTAIPDILQINQEECFVFTFRNHQESSSEFESLSQTQFTENCYLYGIYVIYYPGNDSCVHQYLTSLGQA